MRTLFDCRSRLTYVRENDEDLARSLHVRWKHTCLMVLKTLPALYEYKY